MDEKIPLYKKLAKRLVQLTKFTTTKDIAESIDVDPKKVAVSMSAARFQLASDGIIIINKIKSGYRVGSFDEFRKEVDKSCRRSLAHAKKMANLIKALEASEKINEDFDEIKELVGNNAKSIQLLFEQPKPDDFDSEYEYQEAMAKDMGQNAIVPEEIKAIPHEMVDDFNQNDTTIN